MWRRRLKIVEGPSDSEVEVGYHGILLCSPVIGHCKYMISNIGFVSNPKLALGYQFHPPFLLNSRIERCGSV